MLKPSSTKHPLIVRHLKIAHTDFRIKKIVLGRLCPKYIAIDTFGLIRNALSRKDSFLKLFFLVKSACMVGGRNFLRKVSHVMSCRNPSHDIQTNCHIASKLRSENVCFIGMHKPAFQKYPNYTILHA